MGVVSKSPVKSRVFPVLSDQDSTDDDFVPTSARNTPPIPEVEEEEGEADVGDTLPVRTTSGKA